MKTTAAVLACALGVAAPSAQSSLDDAFAAYWAASSRAEAAAAGERILSLDPAFDELLRRLEAGPVFDPDAATGSLMMERHNADGTRYPFLVIVPDDYDSARSYALRVYLHGGVNRPLRDSDGGWWRNPQQVADSHHIAVFPYSWDESLWWHASQVENLSGILWRLKRTYNVDDNRVAMFGVSDGGTGVWFFAFRDATPWAAFLPFIGHPAVLSSPRVGAGGDMFPINLRNKAFYVVNGGRDRLYPVDAVAPFMALFDAAGVDLTFVPKPESGHSTSWWPDEAEAIEAFLAVAPRDPYPDHVWWRTDRTDRYQRAHWIVIDELDGEAGTIDESNRVIVSGRSYAAFPRRGPSGQLEVLRDGNEVTVTARGVGRYTLLLSPSEFDFDAPIIVHTNGEESFRGRVEKNPAVLIKWAIVDADRTMLFAAELSVEVGRNRAPASPGGVADRRADEMEAALLEDPRPAQPRLGALQRQELEQGDNRHAPIPIVVRDHQGVVAGPSAAPRERRRHCLPDSGASPVPCVSCSSSLEGGGGGITGVWRLSSTIRPSSTRTTRCA